MKISDGTAAHTLEAGADPGFVHHLKHDLDALSFFPQKLPVTPSVVTEVDGAGRAPVEAHLLFDLGYLVVVSPAQRAVVVHDVFGDDEDGNAPGTGGIALNSGQNGMNDVCG